MSQRERWRALAVCVDWAGVALLAAAAWVLHPAAGLAVAGVGLLVLAAAMGSAR